MKSIRYIESALVFMICAGAATFMSCDRFLDAKPEKSMVIPSKLADLQALLDNSPFINYGYYPGLLEMGADDYYVTSSIFNGLPDFERSVYKWDDEPYYAQLNLIDFWKNCYAPVLTANTVLDELPVLQNENEVKAAEIRGAALFLRAFSFYQLAQVYAEPYEINGDNGGLGIPLRLTPDFNERSVRSTVKETYEQILKDLKEAFAILPDRSNFQTQPNKASASAMLARVYLSMEAYEDAGAYAEEALKRHAVLIDYNKIDLEEPIPFEVMNEETIFYAYSNGNMMLNPTRALISKDLLNQYDEHDLRRSAYYQAVDDDLYSFKGSYSGGLSGTFFVGLATDELYLIRAESYARQGNVSKAMDNLNQMMKYRWKVGEFTPYEARDAENALLLILAERRKGLVMRGVRWSDLRRLNRDPRFAKTLVRTVDNGGITETYTLGPNDKRYTYLIPQDVILKTGMQQNLR